jgi:hypothetical protein
LQTRPHATHVCELYLASTSITVRAACSAFSRIKLASIRNPASKSARFKPAFARTPTPGSSGVPLALRVIERSRSASKAMRSNRRTISRLTNLRHASKNVVGFYNKRGTAEQWIKEGKGAIKWTRLSCHPFNANAVRLQLHALAYNLGNFLRTLATPEPIAEWSLTSLREKLIKIGAKVVRHGRYVTFQMAEVAIPRELFAAIMQRIAALRSPPMATAT